MSDATNPVQVTAVVDESTCTIEATNVGTATVHVFDCEAMPYLLPDGDGLLALHGLHEPPEDRDYWGIEIPPTRPFAPGDILRGSVGLDPLWVHSHYGTGDRFVGLATPMRIRTAVGWGHEPLDDVSLASMNVHLVCRSWQQISTGPELVWEPPPRDATDPSGPLRWRSD